MNPNPKFWTLKEVHDYVLPAKDWVVKGWYGHSSRVAIAGDSGAQKTWIMLSQLLHIAAGKEWLGLEIPKPRRVLYVDEEMPQDFVFSRLKRLMAGHEIDPDVPFTIMNKEQFRMKMLPIKQLVSKEFPYDLVCVETLVRTMDGDPLQNKDLAEFWRLADWFIEKTKRTFIIIHHMGKPSGPDLPQRDNIHRVLGGQELVAGSDATLTITRKRKGNGWVNESTIHAEKTRGGTEGDAFQVCVVDLGPHDKCETTVDGNVIHEFPCRARIERVIKPTKKSQPAPVSHSVPPSDSKLWEHPAPSPA